MTIKIVDKDANPVLPGTGLTSYAQLVGISLLALGISVTYVSRRKKEEQ